MRIKVVVQSPLALVPQLHMLSHSQTGEQQITIWEDKFPAVILGLFLPYCLKSKDDD